MDAEQLLIFQADASAAARHAFFSDNPTTAYEKLDGIHRPSLHRALLSSVPPPDASTWRSWGDQANAFTAAVWSVKE